MVFYITFRNLKSTGHAGIRKKVIAQAKALEKEMGRVYYTFWCNQMAYLMHEEEIIERELAITRREYGNVLIRWIEKYHVKSTYVRYPLSDQSFIDFLKYQKEKGIRTVLEIPTYPYDNELPEGRGKKEDAYYRRMVGEFIDIISTYSYDTEIWGKKCISLTNGIDIEKIPPYNKKEKNDKIVMIAVGCMEPWHGFERLLKGMGNYYLVGGGRKVYLKLVGEGVELNGYRKSIEYFKIQDYVEICGQKEGDGLSECFHHSDIAIGSLGFYKNGIKEGSPIKGAEYCARGLPLVIGYTDMRFPKEVPFVLQVPNDSSAIDIEQIINFYDYVIARKNYQEEIRSYAEHHLSWNIIMRPVAEYLKKEVKSK